MSGNRDIFSDIFSGKSIYNRETISRQEHRIYSQEKVYTMTISRQEHRMSERL